MLSVPLPVPGIKLAIGLLQLGDLGVPHGDHVLRFLLFSLQCMNFALQAGLVRRHLSHALLFQACR